ncbi:hypothetical protein CCZ01_07355 [Helicobacter monodelphidis]|uniref:hypothetical protein n=1 Tax=Helicobacter sp. 15-1451 TaxID=2004995 RepID=UPI000DCC3823|nr:hypothetical protein [Helicobacter sp. 15-1451]RAX57055.1 hypothetical protein CCZ01_07355 [Helicobacter sp. 15-1451]
MFNKTLCFLLLFSVYLFSEPQFRLFDSVLIESDFNGQPPKDSYGVWLEGGYILGSEASLFIEEEWARSARIKILDAVGMPLIYFATLEPYAVDRDQKIVLFKIASFTDPYGNPTEMNRFHLETLQKRGMSFIPREDTARRSKSYKKVPIGGGFIPASAIPKARGKGAFYLANQEPTSQSILYYPYAKKGNIKITRSQLAVYLKEYHKIPPDLVFYTTQKKAGTPKVIDVSSELKNVAKEAKKEKNITGVVAISSLSNLYPSNPIGAPVWDTKGNFEGITIASRPKDNLMLTNGRVFAFFCAIATNAGYEEPLRKRILKACPASFKQGLK